MPNEPAAHNYSKLHSHCCCFLLLNQQNIFTFPRCKIKKKFNNRKNTAQKGEKNNPDPDFLQQHGSRKKNVKFNGANVIKNYTPGSIFLTRKGSLVVKAHFYTCVLERHLHCPTRGPLSKSISKPALLEDNPYIYLWPKQLNQIREKCQ